MLKLIVLAAVAGLATTACNTSKLYYNRLSDEQIGQYNSTVGTWDQVYCVSEVRVGSHIRKRHCATILEMQGQGDRSAAIINALNYGSSGIFEQ